MQDSRKEIIAWSLYDWANSAFATTVMAAFFPIFFSQYWSMGADSATSTFYLGVGNSIASLLVAIISPVVGAIADRGSCRKRFLVMFAYIGAVMTFALSLLQSGAWVAAVFIYVIANIGFASANSFYDSLLTCVASEKKVDFVSSLGFSLGYIGGGLLFLINILMYLFPSLFSIADAVQAVKLSFVSVGVWWAVFTIPLILYVKEPKGPSLSISDAAREGFKDLGHTLRNLRKLPNTALFLVGYWCYIDGVDTIIKMATDYGTSLGFPASSLIVALLITQFVAFPSAILYNTFGQKVGVKRALQVAIGAYTIIAVFGFFMTKVLHFYLLAVCIGLFQGGIQALSRSYFSRLIPKENSSQFYGFFNMLGKFASIVGPLLFGVVTLLTGQQRFGILSLIVLFAFGFVLLTKVREDQIEPDLKAYSEAK